MIGETARLGDDVIIMQGVTLGGNGKERGDRHPKLGKCSGSLSYRLVMARMRLSSDLVCRCLSPHQHHLSSSGSGVLVAAGSTVLGNIAIGDGVIISAVSIDHREEKLLWTFGNL